MTTRRLVIWITFLAIFAMSARISMDTDTWWHLRAGQWILENYQIPQVDPFSYTREGASWEYPGWLVEVPMLLIYQTFGPGGMNIWTALWVTLAFWFVWKTMNGGEFLKAFIIILAATASGVYWAARPYLVTFLFIAMYLWILETYRWQRDGNKTTRIWWLPFLMIIWVNSHGGFILGFIIWGVYWISEASSILWDSLIRRKNKFKLARIGTPLLMSGVLMVLAVCVNPYGADMFLYPLKTIQIGVLREYIQEWQTPQFHSLSVQPFAWLLLLTFGFVGASRKRLAFIDFSLISIFAYLGLLAGRNVALFSIVAPMVISRHAAPIITTISRWISFRAMTTGSPSKKLQIVNAGIFAILVLSVLYKVTIIYPNQVNEAAFKEYLPIEAVNYLKTEKPQGMLFNSYNWGGYLLWALPEYPVFVDGRTDLYNDEIIGEWLDVIKAEGGWQELLNRYGVGIVLIENGSALDRALLMDTEWERVYEDSLAVVYEKR